LTSGCSLLIINVNQTDVLRLLFDPWERMTEGVNKVAIFYSSSCFWSSCLKFFINFWNPHGRKH